MNFVVQLEDYLRDLGAEARKKHPGVKEASERAILKLRTLQNNYVSAVRKASADGEKHPDTTMFRSSDLLHPFLLAANYPNASPKLLDTTFKAMKTLMEANAVCPGDGMNLVRVWMIQAQVVVSYSTKDTPSTGVSPGGASLNMSHGGSGVVDSISGSHPNSSSQSTGSWLGSFLSSSSTTTMTTVISSKTAVSSSHGQAGSGHLNAKDLEKLALDILSCLLQLLELRDLPVTTEQWIQSVSICCLLYLPSRQTVRQAAQSTLPQVLSLLVKDDSARDLAIATWEDLLTCALGIPRSAAAVTSSSTSSSKKSPPLLKGAFSHCRLGEKDAAQTPSPALSLDLLTTLLNEAPSLFLQVGQKTFGIVLQIFQKQSNDASTLPLEYLGLLQFVLAILTTHSQQWPLDCRELIFHLIQPINQATESLRKQVDFEDGYIYKVHNKTLLPSTASIDTLRGIPPTLLWKVALSIDTLKTLIHDKSLRAIWMHTAVLVQLLEATSDFCTIGASCEDHMNLVVLACRKKEQPLAYDAESLTSIEFWKKGKTKEDTYVLGEAVWTGFNTILKMIEFLEESALDQAFAPSLAVLQHYLKRFPASGTIVKRALEGYFTLAKISLKRSLIRRALLTSLCKLSLPQWGTHDPNCLLRDHNIAALICLVNMIHRFYDSIGPEWSIVLQTFQELSVLPIASPHLSDSAYVGALSISAVYSRFASFSTCLSDEALSYFVEGLKEVSQHEQAPNLITSPLGGNELLLVPSKSTDGNSKDEKDTIGKTLMSIGARVIYRGSSDTNGNQAEDVPLTERTKNTYSHDYQAEFAQRITESKHPMRFHQVPFTFYLLVDVAMTNAFRSSNCGAMIYRSLCGLASDVPTVRFFAMDAVAMLIMSRIAGDDDSPAPFRGPGRMMYSDPRQNQYLAVEKVPTKDDQKTVMSQETLLAPLCECICRVQSAVVAEAGIEALHAILESCGHDFDNDAWTTVIEAVASLPTEHRSSAEWSSSCLIGFRCLKLIVDDFAALTEPSTAARTSLLDCCYSFGSSHHDVNTSLTAIGLLWNIADQDSGTTSIDLALSKLVVLCTDKRAEVRNCAVNTLFSCIAGRGQLFSNDQWRSCLCDMVLTVYDKVTGGMDLDATPSGKNTGSRNSRYIVSVHHSRDSAGKQWIATQSLVLRGLCRMLRIFFVKLLLTTEDGMDTTTKQEGSPWFDEAWNKVLGCAFDASIQVGGRDTLELRTVGSELLVLCAQVSCKQGIQAAIPPARVGTNMEVVNGALRSVRTPEKSESTNKTTNHRFHSVLTETWRENLFLDAFDVLDSFREHLENDLSDHHESGLHHTLEPTQLQVLGRFAEDMGRLYDCCKNDEFSEDRSFESIEDFEKFLCGRRPKAGEGDPLVSRFAQIIATVAVRSTSSPDARFLSQAQKSCLDILRTMAADGSPEAFLTLTELAGDAFFWERDENGKAKTGVEILAHDASTVIHEEFVKDTLSHETQVLVLFRMLTIFQDGSRNSQSPGHDTSYKLLASLIARGLAGANELQMRSKNLSPSKVKWLDSLWDKITLTLNHMLIPKTKGSEVSIPHAADLINVVAAVSDSTPPRRRDEISVILLSCASKCLEFAKGDPPRRDEMLQLFTACFTGVCKVDPKNRTLKVISDQVLTATILAVDRDSNQDSTVRQDVDVQACLIVCQVLQEVEGADVVAIAVFPQLCRLVAVEWTELRKSIGTVLSKVDIGRVLAESDASRLAAEERAVVAEIKVVELTKELEKLQDEKEALERQLALI